MRIAVVMCFILSFSLPAAPLPFSKQKKRDATPPGLEVLQGKWVVTRFTAPGMAINLDTGGKPCLTATIRGHGIEFQEMDGGVPTWGRLSLHGSTPGSRAVFALDGGQLTLALVPPGSRPVTVAEVSKIAPAWILRRAGD